MFPSWPSQERHCWMRRELTWNKSIIGLKWIFSQCQDLSSASLWNPNRRPNIYILCLGPHLSIPTTHTQTETGVLHLHLTNPEFIFDWVKKIPNNMFSWDQMNGKSLSAPVKYSQSDLILVKSYMFPILQMLQTMSGCRRTMQNADFILGAYNKHPQGRFHSPQWSFNSMSDIWHKQLSHLVIIMSIITWYSVQHSNRGRTKIRH